MTDGLCVPCSGASGRAVSIPPYTSHGNYKQLYKVKILSLRRTCRHTSFVCNANSGGHRRNPEFSRQNKQGFSRGRNRHNDERDVYQNFEESEVFSSRNGPLLTGSNTQKFHATATPGPREKEIVELFRKVQAQLRERAAMKEEKKTESSQGKGKDGETVDSLLKLLRKHSVQKGKRGGNSSSEDFILNQSEPTSTVSEEKEPNFFGSNRVQHESKETEAPVVTRPRSDFRRRSPVPPAKFEHINTEEESDLDQEREIHVSEHKVKTDSRAVFSEEDVFGETSDDETSETYDEEDNNKVTKNVTVTSDLNEMKLPELKALAKSRGLKRFSKLKKHELIELLSG